MDVKCRDGREDGADSTSESGIMNNSERGIRLAAARALRRYRNRIRDLFLRESPKGDPRSRGFTVLFFSAGLHDFAFSSRNQSYAVRRQQVSRVVLNN